MEDLKKPEVFAKLYENVYQDMYRFALYTLGNVQDAEDVVGEAVADAYGSISSLRCREAFRAWIFKILSNKCKRKLKEYVNKTIELPQELEGHGTSMEENVQVRTAFGKLAQEERLLVAMQVWGGYNSREIGRLLRMNDNTVRSKISRALGKMRESLK